MVSLTFWGQHVHIFMEVANSKRLWYPLKSSFKCHRLINDLYNVILMPYFSVVVNYLNYTVIIWPTRSKCEKHQLSFPSLIIFFPSLSLRNVGCKLSNNAKRCLCTTGMRNDLWRNLWYYHRCQLHSAKLLSWSFYVHIT